MIYKSFETYCDKYSDKILSELETEIESLNLPKFVADRLIEVITDCEGEIYRRSYTG